MGADVIALEATIYEDLTDRQVRICRSFAALSPGARGANGI
jgi:hypothetical protein